jgi:hypothetical protein
MFLDIKYEICVAFPMARPEELDGKVGNMCLGNIMNEVQARVIDGSTVFEVLHYVPTPCRQRVCLPP